MDAAGTDAVAPRPAAKASSGIAPGVVALLALAVFISYVDRGNLATAAPLIKDQLRLTNTQVGLLLSAFFWTYTPGLLLAGWLAERINAYRTLAIGVAIWSLATAATGLANGFLALIALRLLLGLGESAVFPCSSKLLAEHLPRKRLGAANGLIGAGLALGPAFGTLAGGLVMAKAGWRPAFIVFGLVSILWLVPWLLATRQASAHADGKPRAVVPSFAAIARQPAAWGASLGHFCGNYAFYFVVSWLPLYLVKAQGFSLSQMAELGGVIYVVYALSAQATGWICDRWMHAGASDTRARKTFLVSASVGAAICMLACAFGGALTAIVALLLAAVFFGFATPNIFAAGQTLAGPAAAGKWIGLQNAIANIAGVIAPIVTGFVVDRTGQFASAFLIAGAVSVTGAVGWGLIVRRIEPVRWRQGAGDTPRADTVVEGA
jgi:MFS family permease